MTDLRCIDGDGQPPEPPGPVVKPGPRPGTVWVLVDVVAARENVQTTMRIRDSRILKNAAWGRFGWRYKASHILLKLAAALGRLACRVARINAPIEVHE